MSVVFFGFVRRQIYTLTKIFDRIKDIWSLRKTRKNIRPAKTSLIPGDDSSYQSRRISLSRDTDIFEYVTKSDCIKKKKTKRICLTGNQYWKRFLNNLCFNPHPFLFYNHTPCLTIILNKVQGVLAHRKSKSPRHRRTGKSMKYVFVIICVQQPRGDRRII